MLDRVKILGNFPKRKQIAVSFGIVVLIAATNIFYLHFFKKGLESEFLTMDCAYFRKLSTSDNGTVYLFLKNDGNKPVGINQLIFNDIPLSGFTLSELMEEGNMGDSGLIPPPKAEENDQVLWYYIYPNPVPPRKIAKVVVKYGSPSCKLINITVESAKGKRYRSVLQPKNNPLRFTYIGFNKELNKVFLYLENSETTPMQIARVYINSHDATKDSFRPWETLNINEKKCIEVNLKNPLTKGEFVTAKVITTDGLSTESMVRASSFFPIAAYDGLRPDFNLDPQEYRIQIERGISPTEKDRSIIPDQMAHILDCPSHAHGTWQNAAQKIISGVETCRDIFPFHPTSIYICTGQQEKSSFAFSEIADIVITNPTELPGYWEKQFGRPAEQTAFIMKEGSSPHSWHALVNAGYNTGYDNRLPEFINRLPTPEEERFILYHGLSQGAKGIFYYFPNWEKAPEIARESLRKEIKKLNAELQSLRDSLLISEPIPLAICSQPQVEPCTLQAGYNGIILLLINHDIKSTPDNFTYKPKTNFTVRIKVPEGVEVDGINEVTAEKLIPVNYNTKNGEIILPINELNLTRQFFIKTTLQYETNKSQSLEVKKLSSDISIVISGKGTPKEIFAEAKINFDKINNQKWCPQNLKEYNKVIKLSEKVISNSKEKTLILNAQQLVIDCYNNQAEHQKERDAYNRYIDMIEKYYSKEQAAMELVKAGNNYFNNGYYFDALCYFKNLLVRYPSNKQAAYVQYKIAAIYAAMENTDKAINGFRMVMINYPQEKELVEKSFLFLVGIYRKGKKYAEAVVTLQELMAKLPPNSNLIPSASFNLGYFYYKQGNQIEAKKIFTDLVQKYPGNIWAFQARAFLVK